MSNSALRFTVDRVQEKVTRHYADGRTETKDYSESARRAIQISRERRKPYVSEGARKLREVLDRLDAEAAQRQTEGAASLAVQQKPKRLSLLSRLVRLFT